MALTAGMTLGPYEILASQGDRPVRRREPDCAAIAVRAAQGVVRGGFNGRYVPSGHLVFMHGGSLFAVPFDLNRLEVTGQVVPVIDGVPTVAGGGAQFAVSGHGTLVYAPGQAGLDAFPIDWMDREGKTRPLRTTSVNWTSPRFSADGRRLAFDSNESGQTDVWVADWQRDTASRLTSSPGNHQEPVWTPDGQRIVYAADRNEGAFNLFWQRADGSGEVQRLTESINPQYPSSWHPSGKFLAFAQVNARTSFDLMILPMDGSETSGWKPGKPYPFLASSFSEVDPMFSPDGRWLAYQSNETGRTEVYVSRFPALVASGRSRSPTAVCRPGHAAGTSCSTPRPLSRSWRCLTPPMETRSRPRSRGCGRRGLLCRARAAARLGASICTPTATGLR